MTFGTEQKLADGIIAYLGLGTNLGDRQANIQEALRELEKLPATTLVRVSSLYESAPVGVLSQPDFLNLVAAVETELSAHALLDVLLHIENQMGRVRTERWGPRVIDIDLLVYGDQQIRDPKLTVPHPRLRERDFVLIPLAEIAPELAMPEDGQNVLELTKIILGDFTLNGNIRRVNFV